MDIILTGKKTYLWNYLKGLFFSVQIVQNI